LIRPGARTVAFAVGVSFYFLGLNTMALTTIDRESAGNGCGTPSGAHSDTGPAAVAEARMTERPA
jgi:hypothetical protein